MTGPLHCTRMRIASGPEGWSAWVKTEPAIYNQHFLHTGSTLPKAGITPDFRGVLVEGRVITGAHQIPGWDQDLRKVWALHEAELKPAPLQSAA